MKGSDHEMRSSESQTVVAQGRYDQATEDLIVTLLELLDTLPKFDAEGTGDVLADSVDPDALENLFRSTNRTAREAGRVTFPIGAYEVTVTATGEILVWDRE